MQLTARHHCDRKFFGAWIRMSRIRLNLSLVPSSVCNAEYLDNIQKYLSRIRSAHLLRDYLILVPRFLFH